MLMILWAILIGCAAGTIVACALFRGARSELPEPILRATPRPTDWLRHEGDIAS